MAREAKTGPLTVRHHTFIGGIERAWAVDPAAAADAAGWAARKPEVLATDLAGMAEHFPHWVLGGAERKRPARCAGCKALLVPARGAMRCVRCDGEGRVEGLLWLGHIPALARPEPAFRQRQSALQEAGFGQVTVGRTTYLLVPLTVLYPAEWPNVKPGVRYSRRWLEALGLPRSSGAHHLVRNGQACLFGWGQWSAMPVHAVLQQRVVNHIASLLKVAAGQKPERAFIGQGHHTTGLES